MYPEWPDSVMTTEIVVDTELEFANTGSRQDVVLYCLGVLLCLMQLFTWHYHMLVLPLYQYHFTRSATVSTNTTIERLIAIGGMSRKCCLKESGLW